MATLEELIRLLDYPTFLAEKISQLKSNESNSEEVDGFIFLFDQFNGDTNHIKKYLAESKEKIVQSNLSKKIHTLRWVKYAAIFLAILGIGTYLKFQTDTVNYYKAYVDTDPGLPVYMSINTNKLDNWMLEYKEKNYSKALQTGLNLLNENPNNDTICYYLGVIQLELNHPKQAEHYFSKIDTQKSTFAEQTIWLEAICNLYFDKVNAKRLLETIAQSDSFYQTKAKELLAKEF